MTPQNCVFCQSPDNLNTELTIKLDDGTKVPVQICDEHSDRSPKDAKEAYVNTKGKIDALLAQLAQMGVTMAPQGQLVLPTSQPTPQAPAAPTVQPVHVQKEQMPVDPVDARSVLLKREFTHAMPTSVVDKKVNATSIGGSSHGGFERHASLDTSNARKVLSEQLEGVVEVESIEGRCGVPIQVPTKRLDGTGMTRINIVKSSDAELQSRFRNLNDAPPMGGYQLNTRPCPMCHGEAVVRSKGVEILCPKCNGSGEIGV